MAGKVDPIPKGFHTVTPYLTIRGAADAIEFYKKVFGAEEVERITDPSRNLVSHAEIKIGDSIIMLSDEFPHMGCLSPQTIGNTTGSLYLYVEDVDAVYKRAVAGGAQELMPVGDMFWGDRFGQIVDPFGHKWGIATRKEDLTPEEIQKRAAEMAPVGSKT